MYHTTYTTGYCLSFGAINKSNNDNNHLILFFSIMSHSLFFISHQWDSLLPLPDGDGLAPWFLIYWPRLYILTTSDLLNARQTARKIPKSPLSILARQKYISVKIKTSCRRRGIDK